MNTFGYMDHLLRNREQVISDLQDPDRVGQLTKVSFVVFLLLSVVYGLIMGSQSLMHGSADGWKYALAAGMKLPLLFLLTLAICLPLLYVLNVLIGPRAHPKVVLGMLIASFAVTSIVLASCALILGFFMLSTRSYPFIKLLNVAIFALAGLYGVWFLSRALHVLSRKVEPDSSAKADPAARSGVGTIITWWLITYGIVGTQMAWLMRPFIGSPGTHFQIFRAQDSNFYVDVATTIGKLFGL